MRKNVGAELRGALLREGVELWARVDLPVLCDACRENPRPAPFSLLHDDKLPHGPSGHYCSNRKDELSGPLDAFVGDALSG